MLKFFFKELHEADIIDIGAESSRPGSNPINIKIEFKRLSKIFDLLIDKNKYYSIDTYKPEVAELTLSRGRVIRQSVSQLESVL